MKTTKPPKELTRRWLEDRTHAEDPPPTLEEIRRQLGWELIKHDQRPEVPE